MSNILSIVLANKILEVGLAMQFSTATRQHRQNYSTTNPIHLTTATPAI
jgi:hypothetical protein